MSAHFQSLEHIRKYTNNSFDKASMCLNLDVDGRTIQRGVAININIQYNNW